MSFEPANFAAASETAMPDDVRNALKTLAKSVRAPQHADTVYPGRSALMAILTDARVRIDRINAPAG